MKKSVSILAIMLVGVMSAFPSDGAQMTSQIQRLLEQKEEKIKKLEECEGKKKGWMIAGISTIGLTAVGVGVNIAQASKSNKLSDEIDATKTELERQQDRLSGIESQIAQKEREKAERERTERERIEREQAERDAAQNGDGGGDNVVHGDYKDRKPDGKVGDICDNGKGIWATGGDKLCVDATGGGVQDCTCKPNGDNVVKDGKDEPERLTSLQKCLRDRQGDREGTACCYLNKSVAEYVDGKCECKGDKEFSIGADGKGVCVKPEKQEPEQKSPKACDDGYVRIIGGGNNGPCVKRDYMRNDKCACKDGTNDCSLKTDANGTLVCQTSKGWGEKCRCEEKVKEDAKDKNDAIDSCFSYVRNYLVRECPKCVGELNSNHEIEAREWDLNGKEMCADIVASKGLYEIEWERTDKSNGNTVFKLIAKDSSSRWLFCPQKCGKAY